MEVTFLGSRGSIASAGPETVRYGGNTACVEVAAADGTTLLLDAGTGIRRARTRPWCATGPVHVLITHLHMDHVQGLGFFGPLFEPGREVHIWGPRSSTMDLRTRLTRYLSPPLFPVLLRDLPADVTLHDVPNDPWRIGSIEIRAAGIIHPGQTTGYRLSDESGSIAYLGDHEPAMGEIGDPAWTSGFDLAEGVDLLIHDGQYTTDEYAMRAGWGHSSVDDAVRFAELAGARRLALFHHDPDHDDATMDRLVASASAQARTTEVDGAREGATISIRPRA